MSPDTYFTENPMSEVYRTFSGKTNEPGSHSASCVAVRRFSEIHARKTLLILIGFLLLTYMVHGFGKAFDEDEFQSMLLGINIAQGKLLYTEMWDNHGPLLSLILAGMYRLVPWQSHWVMLLGRLLILLCLLGTLYIYYRLAEEIFPQSSFFPELACFFLLLSELTALAAVEIRPDNPMNLIWTSSLLVWFRAWNSRKVPFFFGSGLLLGCAFWCSLKALVLGGAVGAMFVTGMILEKRILWKPLLTFGVGTVFAPLGMVLFLAAQGNLEAFWTTYVLQNADRLHESFFIAFFLVPYWAPLGGSFLYFSLFYAARKVFRKETVPERILLLLACSFFLLIQYCFLLPTHHEQSTLPFLMTGTLVQAWVFLLLFQRFETARYSIFRRLQPGRAHVAALVLFLLVSTAGLHQWFWIKSVEKIKWADGLLERIDPGEYVFDGIGLPLFRSHPFYYVSWVNALRARLRDHSLGIDVPAELDRKDVRYVLRDFRVESMGASVDAFIRTNYHPLNDNLLWAAGKVVPEEKHQEHQKVDIRIAGKYYWRSSEGELFIGGKPASNPVELGDGSYVVRWKGEGDLILSVAPPEQWAGVDTERSFRLLKREGYEKADHSNSMLQ